MVAHVRVIEMNSRASVFEVGKAKHVQKKVNKLTVHKLLTRHFLIEKETFIDYMYTSAKLQRRG